MKRLPALALAVALALALCCFSVCGSLAAGWLAVYAVFQPAAYKFCGIPVWPTLHIVANLAGSLRALDSRRCLATPSVPPLCTSCQVAYGQPVSGYHLGQRDPGKERP